MPETLLTPSSIKLFGRVMSSLQYTDDTSTTGNNNFLQEQLSLPAGPQTPISITSFSGNTITWDETVTTQNIPDDMKALAEGMLLAGTYPYVPVGSGGSPPAIPASPYLVPGTYISKLSVTGKPASGGNWIYTAKIAISAKPIAPQSSASGSDTQTQTAPTSIVAWAPGVSLARIYGFSFEGAFYGLPRPSLFMVQGLGTSLSPDHWFGGSRSSGEQGSRSSLDQSGVAAREWEFSADNSLVYWEYEKGDFSLRLDTEAGQFEQILLAAALRAGADMADRSGASLGVRSGASLAGASLAGASLSGASLSGASLSGASLSGASLRNGR